MIKMIIETAHGDRRAFVKNLHHVGVGVHIDESVELGSPDFPIEDLYIGDHVALFGPSKFLPRKLVIGDYTKIYGDFWCGGDASRNGHDEPGGEAYFGHNVWLAPRCIADPTGGIYIGNGLGAGAETHIWSHIRHGDVLAGSKYLSYGRFVAEDDVWLVGRCTVNPIWAEAKSMAMTGSMVVSDMTANHIYGGVPAKDLTDRLGAPWRETSYADRWEMFERRLLKFQKKHDVTSSDIASLASRFDLMRRTYKKSNDYLVTMLIRHLLPEAKFVPEDQERIEGIIEWPTR